MTDEGVITRGVGGLYTVVPVDSLKSPESAWTYYSCKARGIFRKENITPLVGDHVELKHLSDGTARMEKILPRRSAFLRPPVANIDLMVIVGSLAIPKSDTFLLDRVTAVCENKGITAVLCFNKNDIIPADTLASVYRKAGYTVILTSAETGEGIDELHSLLRGHVSAFTGNSGVGKSSLLRRLDPSLDLKVGEISEKLGRGRHTTREVTLMPLAGDSLVVDTPGFSAFDPDKMDLTSREDTERAFPEFQAYRENCRFRDCLHIKTPDCAVIKAVERGEIPQSRYDSYTKLGDVRY